MCFVGRKAWKVIESCWRRGRYSYSGADTSEYVHVYASKREAIKMMREYANDWLENERSYTDRVTTTLLDTDERITMMTYDAKLDSWSLVDYILEEIWIG